MCDVVVNVVVPILSSCIGGFIGGLFTFLGVKITIHNSNKIHKEEMDLKEKENLEKQKKINQKINNKIITNRPELEIIEQKIDNIENNTKVYVLPYSDKATLTDNNIYFDYNREELLKKSNWKHFNITFKNVGKTEIVRAFIQLPYKSGLNMYSIYDLNSINFNNHYSDSSRLNCNFSTDEYFKLTIYYPKNLNILQKLDFNIYFADKNENYWLQEFLKSSYTQSSFYISKLEYIENYKSNINETFIYDHMFFDDKNVIKKLPPTIKDEYKFLQEKKDRVKKLMDKMEDFKNKLKNNEIALKEPPLY